MSDVRSIKIKYQEELRRFSVDSLQPFTVATIEEAVRSTFPGLRERRFRLTYVDEESDTITVTADVELEEAMSVAHAQALKVLRFDVQELTAFIAAPGGASGGGIAEHKHVICDGCGANPIVGTRYKCSVRKDFDLCEACEAINDSPHAFLKIKTPAMAPAAIMTILHPNQPCDFEQVVKDTEQRCGGKVEIAEPKDQADEAEGAASSSGPYPGFVMLECLATVRRFGPYTLQRKPNHTLVFRGPEVPNGQPLKDGGCLHIGKRNMVDMGGAGGPWASFHLEVVSYGSKWTSDEAVRLVSANRKACIAGINGKLCGVPACQRGPHTHFKLIPMTAEEVKAHVARSPGAPTAAAEEPPAEAHFLHQAAAFFEKLKPRGAMRPIPAPVHVGVACDKSGMSPIIGPRYHVLSNNYDLCEAEFNMLPECERVLYVKIAHPGASPEPCAQPDAILQETAAAEEPTKEPTAAAEEPAATFEHPVESAAEKLAKAVTPCLEESSGEDPDLAYARLVSETWNAEASVEAPPLPALSRAPKPLDVSFVADVTVPDGIKVAPGEAFVKVWRLRNDSDVSFPAGVRLVHLGGSTLGAEFPSYDLSRAVLPLEEFEVSLPLVAPAVSGPYTSYWGLEVDGTGFGHRIWAQIQVEAPTTEAEPSAAQSVAAKAAEEAVKAAVAQVAHEAGKEESAPVLSETLYDSVPALESSVPSLLGESMPPLEDSVPALESSVPSLLGESMPPLGDSVENTPPALSPSSSGELSTGEWERVDAPAEAAKALAAQVPEPLKVSSDELSCSFEGSAMAGSLLAGLSDEAEGVSDLVEPSPFVKAMDAFSPAPPKEKMAQTPKEDLSVSVQDALNISYGKWALVVDRLTDMGFTDVPAIISLCEKHATPETAEASMQTIVDELLASMPAL